MKWTLFVVIVFSLLTAFELYKDYKQGHFPKKTYMIIGIIESMAAIISIVLLFCIIMKFTLNFGGYYEHHKKLACWLKYHIKNITIIFIHRQLKKTISFLTKDMVFYFALSCN